jgi:hypothetical protein
MHKQRPSQPTGPGLMARGSRSALGGGGRDVEAKASEAGPRRARGAGARPPRGSKGLRGGGTSIAKWRGVALGLEVRARESHFALTKESGEGRPRCLDLFHV